MKFYITGGTGFIGSTLSNQLKIEGHDVIQLERDEKSWPEFTETYGMINLAGAPIFTRFTKKNKELIYNSRIHTTKAVCDAIEKSTGTCEVIVSASAVGFYGDRDTSVLNEQEPAGKDFLATVCKDWEKVINDFASQKNIRIVNIRTGYVLGMSGMLSALLPIFKLGLGGRLGEGRQYMPWISHEDIVRLYIFVATNQNVSGPINASAPNVVTNIEFTNALAKALHRPAWFMVPKFALKLLYGELGELMLYSQNTTCNKILNYGFQFKYLNIYDCLSYYINKK